MKNFIKYATINVVNLVLLAIAMVFSNLVYQLIESAFNESVSYIPAVASILLATVTLYIPAVWCLNKFVIKPEAGQFIKTFLKENALFLLALAFFLLGILSGSSRNSEISQPIMLAIISSIALISNGVVLFLVSKKERGSTGI